ncbi:hypothetical protein ACFYV7_39340 [Nocardia suismassiliense]|uniref:Uncharacterized protein n=1 Tax=Nocardia suismassiliense TaxID=2077092 RepID=A0ABW6R6L8_9NOCA
MSRSVLTRVIARLARSLQPARGPRISVHLNQDRSALERGYHAGDPLTLVYRDRLPALTPGITDRVILDRVFAAANDCPASPDYEQLAHHWASHGLRSFSVGDVVVIGRRAFACQRFGWDQLSSRP